MQDTVSAENSTEQLQGATLSYALSSEEQVGQDTTLSPEAPESENSTSIACLPYNGLDAEYDARVDISIGNGANTLGTKPVDDLEQITTEYAPPVTTRQEELFNNLMEVSPSIATPSCEVVTAMFPSRSTTLSRTDATALQRAVREQNSDSDESTSEDDLLHQPPQEFGTSPFPSDDTPKSTPHSIRRWRIPKIALPTTVVDNDVTPIASPCVVKHSLPVHVNAPEESSDEEVLPNREQISKIHATKSTSPSASTCSVVTSKTRQLHKPTPLVSDHPQPPKSQMKAVRRSQSFNINYHKKSEAFATPPTGLSLYHSPILSSKAHGSKYRYRNTVAQHNSDFHDDRYITRKKIPVEEHRTTTRDDNEPDNIFFASSSPDEATANEGIEPQISTTPFTTCNHSTSLEVQNEAASSPHVTFCLQRSPKRNSQSKAGVGHSSTSDCKEIDMAPTLPPGSMSVTVLPPYKGNPEERISFDEILASFDEYATQTGESNKHRFATPNLERKVKKTRKKKSNTVATIDQSTMKEVRAQLNAQEHSPLPRARSQTRVQQLAKDYSHRLRDHQRKRHSTVLSSSESEGGIATSDTPTTKPEPGWLTQLKRKTRGKAKAHQDDSSHVASGLSDSHLPASQRGSTLPSLYSHPAPGVYEPSTKTLPHSSDSTYRSSYDEQDESDATRSGFRGWVRTLVDRFSGKDK